MGTGGVPERTDSEVSALRDQWLNGEDVIYDPAVDVAIEELPNMIQRMDIEQRAWFCGLDDRHRGAFLLHLVRVSAEHINKTLIYGKDYDKQTQSV